MNIEEEFSQLMKNAGLGPRLDRESYPSEIQQQYTSLEERAVDLMLAARKEFPALPPIHFDFIQTGQVNAVATGNRDQYYIGVTTGIIFMLQALFFRMLANKSLFPTIGDANSENDNCDNLQDIILDANQMCEKGNLPLRPKDPLRFSYAMYLFDQAFMFLVGHEISHITLGHCDYFCATNNIQMMAELGWMPADSKKMLIRQTLEWSADSRSAFSRVSSVFDMLALATRTNSKFGGYDLFFGSFFAIHIMFRMLGNEIFTKVAADRTPYPPTSLRRAMFDEGLLYAVCRLKDESYLNLVKKQVIEARAYAEICFSQILGVPPDFGSLQSAYSEEGKGHARLLQNLWNSELVEKLRPFSYEF